jgi:hypothetical protein
MTGFAIGSTKPSESITKGEILILNKNVCCIDRMCELRTLTICRLE